LFDKESSTYTYLLADYVAKEAIIIDPVIEQVNRDYSILKRLGLNLLYCGMNFKLLYLRKQYYSKDKYCA